MAYLPQWWIKAFSKKQYLCSDETYADIEQTSLTLSVQHAMTAE